LFIFGNPNATVYDIVKAKDQFHGFEYYPKISSFIKVNLDGFFAIANNYNHSKREDHDEYIENAIAAAAKDALKNLRTFIVLCYYDLIFSNVSWI